MKDSDKLSKSNSVIAITLDVFNSDTIDKEWTRFFAMGRNRQGFRFLSFVPLA